MNISKQRLIEIIKEELQEDMAGNPMFPVKDVESNTIKLYKIKDDENRFDLNLFLI